MANALTITIDDAKKKAICREVVALCGKYYVRVEPAFTGNGNIVLFRKHVLYPPKGTPIYQGGAIVNEKVDKWDANEVYAVVPLTTTDGVTSGTLNLQYEQLVQDFVSRYGVGSEVPLKYEVYDIAGEGLAGSGEFRLKVVEPYTITENQNIGLFKGDKGDPGEDGEDGEDGQDGEDGAAAGFGTPTATAEVSTTGTPSVEVTATGPDTAKIFSFLFRLVNGQDGEDGEDGVDGKSAYEVWKENGHPTGTVNDFLTSLIGGDYIGMQAMVASAVATSAQAIYLGIKANNATAELDRRTAALPAIEIKTNEFGEKIVVAKQ